MPRTIAALMRHSVYHQPADVPSAHLPYPLTEAGRQIAREQGRLLAGTLRERRWTLQPIVDCSPLLRAWETAEIVVAELSLALDVPLRVEQYAELAERGLGAGANLTTEQLRRIVDEDPRFASLPADWKSRSDYRLPLLGAESMSDAGERTAKHIVGRMLGLPDEDDTVKLFVGHGGAFRHAAAALGAMRVDDVQKLSMEHCRPVFIERLADGSWIHAGGSWKVRKAVSAPD